MTRTLFLIVALLTRVASAAGANEVNTHFEAARLAHAAQVSGIEAMDPAELDALEKAVAGVFNAPIELRNPAPAGPPGSEGNALDRFASAVALSVGTAVIGSHLDDVAGQTSQGSVFVFARVAGVWHLQAQLLGSDSNQFDQFGSSVAISGDRLVIGAPFAGTAGAAYVFVRSDETWTEQDKLLPSDGGAGARFGESVAMSGALTVVGAPHADGRGAAYAFVSSAGVWNQTDKLIANDPASGDDFGAAIALSAPNILVGAPMEEAGLLSNRGAAYVFVPTPAGSGTYMQQAKLVAPDGANEDNFGSAVSLSNDTALVGVPGDDLDEADTGSAYVFLRSGITWSMQDQLIPSVVSASDRVGISVVVSGNTALLGSISAGLDQRSIFVFERAGTLWTEQAALRATGGATSDHFGEAVALSGNNALVGAPYDDIGTLPLINVDQGSANVFVRVGSTWTEQARLIAGEGELPADDGFGVAVAASGTRVLIGVSNDDIGPNAFQGSAYVFVRTPTNWMMEAKLTAADGADSDQFGHAVAIDGDNILIGAPVDDVGTDTDAGSVYFYRRIAGTWTEQIRLDGNGSVDAFGWSVALDGDYALVGSPVESAAYIYLDGAGGWSRQMRLVAANRTTADEFGYAVALSGPIALIGAPTRTVDGNGQQGSAYLFERSGITWSEQTQLIAPDGAASDQFGWAVALEGNTALIGAPRDDVNAATDQGSAYVYTGTGSNWTAQDKLIASDGAAQDIFGFAVALTRDTALIGSPEADFTASGEEGAAYLYQRAGGLWLETQKLKRPLSQPADQFGKAVAIDTIDLVAVGVPLADAPLPFDVPNAGAADVYDNLPVFKDSFE